MHRPVSCNSAWGRLSKDAKVPAPSVSPAADTPLKMASASRARRGNWDGLITTGLLIGCSWEVSAEPGEEPAQVPHRAQRLTAPVLDRLHLREHEGARVVDPPFGLV